MIPKIIHYCWLSDDPVPRQFQNYIDGWHRLLPDYEFIKWDFNRFDKSMSSWVEEAYENKKYAFSADYIRLFAVYNYGGIYMDMDIEVRKSFDDLLDKPYMFATERPNKPWIEAGCFGAEKGNEFVGACLERYKNRHFVKPDGGFDQLPLPQVMEEVRRENEMKLDLYPWTYFTAKSYDTGIESPAENTYCIHHFAGSWKTEEDIKNLESTRRLSKIFGYRISHNIVDYCNAVKEEGLKGVIRTTKKKIQRKRFDR